ncbi:hypothetical protein [Stenotrophomonas sp. AS1]|uniref:hypothetical protein n=1 Tax=Stenotrophomonas sp. AS1 TaxID=3029188 RepID=UPI003B79CDB4
MKTYAKTFMFANCQKYGIPNGVHFALQLGHGVEVILFPDPPNFEAQLIPGEEFEKLLKDGTVVDAEAHINALLKDGLSTLLSRE